MAVSCPSPASAASPAQAAEGEPPQRLPAEGFSGILSHAPTPVTVCPSSGTLIGVCAGSSLAPCFLGRRERSAMLSSPGYIQYKGDVRPCATRGACVLTRRSRRTSFVLLRILGRGPRFLGFNGLGCTCGVSSTGIGGARGGGMGGSSLNQGLGVLSSKSPDVRRK